MEGGRRGLIDELGARNEHEHESSHGGGVREGVPKEQNGKGVSLLSSRNHISENCKIKENRSTLWQSLKLFLYYSIHLYFE